MHFVCSRPPPPPKKKKYIYLQTIVLDFSWDHCNTQEKLETMVMQNLGGAVNKLHYALYEGTKWAELPSSPLGGGYSL